MLRNLISNAAKAIDPSSGVGAIRLSAERHDPQHVRIVVADNGSGIPAASRERVLSRSFRARRAAWSWGLAVSRAIAEAHGGSLEAMPGPHGEFCLVPPVEASATRSR